MLPRLNNYCNIFETSKNYRGEFQKTPIGVNVECRLSVSSENVDVGNGQLNAFTLKGWINAGLNVAKGQIIEFESKEWLVISAKTTKDLNGDNFFQYLECKEYATN